MRIQKACRMILVLVPAVGGHGFVVATVVLQESEVVGSCVVATVVLQESEVVDSCVA
jgi:hypothetical protein